ncbi:MAG: hypothetical protein Fur005_33420 [Roseiflexaceae bacterium]
MINHSPLQHISLPDGLPVHDATDPATQSAEYLTSLFTLVCGAMILLAIFL